MWPSLSLPVWHSGINVYCLDYEVVGSNPMFAVIFCVDLKNLPTLDQICTESMEFHVEHQREGKFLALGFKVGLHQEFNISWAKAVAVELGLWVALHC